MTKICSNGKPWGHNGNYELEEYKKKLSDAKKGKNNPFYKTGKRKKYRMKMYKGKRIYEHRLVMQTHLERELESTEFVHHKDGDTLNNNLSNLELIPNGRINHAKFHSDNRMVGL